jgi:hypothetical protein
MNTRSLRLVLAFAACSAATAPALLAQNSILVFGPVDTRASESTASYTAPVNFNTNNLNLSCPASPTAITAVLSSTPNTVPSSSAGNVLVDNNITVSNSYSTSNGTVTTGPTEVCPLTGYAGPTGFPNCFNWNGYGAPASSGFLNGQDPDTYVLPANEGGDGVSTVDQLGGVAPIDISAQLVNGAQTVTFNLVDEGGWLTSSSLYLNTNCTQGAVTGPALVSGNTIPPNPTPQQLTQSFGFDGTTSQQVTFVYDLSGAQQTITVNSNGATPQVADLPINPATFQANFVANTSFATSQCLIHNGEQGGPVGQPQNQPACKLYTLQCTNGTGAAAAGANCPASTVANEVVQDVFDGPNFTLQDIRNPRGQVFHEGIAFIMASDDWGIEAGVPPGTWNWNGGTGGPCAFDPATDLNIPCPQNLLLSFTGPGTYSGTGETTRPNSTFISLAGVPEDHTSVLYFPGLLGWVNTDKVPVQFSSQPPDLRGVNLPGASAFIPSPIQSITYGVSPASGPQPEPANEPINDDTTLTNGTCPVPTAANPGPTTEPTFVPAVQTLNFTADGQYLLHYFAQDCAGTQELHFQQVAGSWQTNFYTVPINVDTTPPVVSSLTLNGALTSGHYKVGEKVSVSYSCSDATSGVVLCGVNFYLPGTLNTGTITTPLSTTSAGTKTVTVFGVDAAGNFSSQSINYTVSK